MNDRWMHAGLLLALSLAMVGGIYCNGPPAEELIYQKMTVDSHNADSFPMTHGDADGCNTCHGGFDSFSDFSCLVCHYHDESTTDASHTGFASYQYESRACYSCHPDGEGMTREAHEVYFPIQSGTAHASSECGECHLSDYSAYSCVDCHTHAQDVTDSSHGNVSGYVYASESCLTCHPDGTSGVSREDHGGFPIAAGTKHESSECSACHTGSSYAEYSCLECHEHEKDTMDTAHGSVSGYIYASENCLGCHPDGTAGISREEHDYFPISSGTKHESADCTTCHTGSSYSEYSCLECHEHAQDSMDPSHNDVSGYQYVSSECLACHPDGVALTRSEHGSYFPITSGTHSRYDCGDCHQDAGTYQTNTCIGCHDDAHTCSRMDSEHQEEGVSGYACEDAKCLSCHPDGRG